MSTLFLKNVTLLLANGIPHMNFQGHSLQKAVQKASILIEKRAFSECLSEFFTGIFN